MIPKIPLLIAPADLRDVLQMSQNVEDVRVTPSLRLAQDADLVNLLGGVMVNRILAGWETGTDAGVEAIRTMLVRYLQYSAATYLADTHGISFDRFGLVVFDSDNSTPATEGDRGRVLSAVRGGRETSQAALMRYMRDHIDAYPELYEWEKGEATASPTAGFAIIGTATGNPSFGIGGYEQKAVRCGNRRNGICYAQNCTCTYGTNY